MNGTSSLAEGLALPKLQAAQDQFARRSGLALITVACTGRPLTEASRFTSFCAIMRADPQQRRRCEGCDAHGGLQSVMDGRPTVYRCHAGLVDFSVPIMRGETYLGAILCGQVRLAEGQDVPYLTTMNSGWQRNADVLRAWRRVPQLDLAEVKEAAAELSVTAADLLTRHVLGPAPSPSLTVEVVTQEAESRHHSLMPARAMETGVAREDLAAQRKVLAAALDGMFSNQQARVSPSLLQPLEDALVRGATTAHSPSGQLLRQQVTRHRATTQESMDRWRCQQYLEGLLFSHHDRMNALPRGPRSFTDLLNHLERHVNRPPTLQQAADYMSVTPSHLSKVFKQRTGTTFISHVTRRRIDRAQDMLLHTEIPVGRIAAELGFQPVNYFSRIFKQQTGLTPSAYRQRGPATRSSHEQLPPDHGTAPRR